MPGLPKIVSKDSIDSETDLADSEIGYEDFDLCKGCHWCNPKSHPEKPPVIPLPEGHIISIFYTDEKEVSNDMCNQFNIYSSYESASKAILKIYKKVNVNYKKPPFSWACKQYNPTVLSKIHQEEQFRLFDDYSASRGVEPQLFFRIGKPE